MTRMGALCGMVVGAATVLIWNHFAWFGLYEIIPGFLFLPRLRSISAACLTANLMTKWPKLSTP